MTIAFCPALSSAPGRSRFWGAKPQGGPPPAIFFSRRRPGTFGGRGVLIGAILLGALAWLTAPAAATEPICGFSRKPVAAWRALTDAERSRLEAWNRAHPDTPLEPERASSLELHFLKHASGGREFVVRGLLGPTARFPTPQAYESAARALASSRAGGRRIRRFRRPDGATITVETATGSIVVVAPDGRIKTFFNAAARCSGREPAVRCTMSPARMARWIHRRTVSGRLIEVDYTTDPLAGPQPLAPLPAPGRPPPAQ